jgi:molecular chaperone DnaK (HSP70)
LKENQKTILIFLLLGDFCIKGFDPLPTEEAKIKVTFEINENSILNVTSSYENILNIIFIFIYI